MDKNIFDGSAAVLAAKHSRVPNARENLTHPAGKDKSRGITPAGVRLAVQLALISTAHPLPPAEALCKPLTYPASL